MHDYALVYVCSCIVLHISRSNKSYKGNFKRNAQPCTRRMQAHGCHYGNHVLIRHKYMYLRGISQMLEVQFLSTVLRERGGLTN